MEKFKIGITIDSESITILDKDYLILKVEYKQIRKLINIVTKKVYATKKQLETRE